MAGPLGDDMRDPPDDGFAPQALQVAPRVLPCVEGAFNAGRLHCNCPARGATPAGHDTQGNRKVQIRFQDKPVSNIIVRLF